LQSPQAMTVLPMLEQDDHSPLGSEIETGLGNSFEPEFAAAVSIRTTSAI